MSTEELKHLLPFYVAGTLEPEEKRQIEEALESSEELRKDLEFWLGAQEAISAHAAYADAGHVSAKAIVDYAGGILTPEQRTLIEGHLQSCSVCSEEYRLVNMSLAEDSTKTPPMLSQLSSGFKSIRLVYAIPAVAAVIVAIVVYFNTTENSSQETPVPSHAPPIVADIPRGVDERVPLWLTYRSEMRSPSRIKILTLAIDKHNNGISAFVAIPHNNVRGIRYAVAVGSEEKKRVGLPDTLERYASNTVHDSLHVVIPGNLIPQPGDTMNITIREVLPDRLKTLTPEEYHFSVLIQRSGKR